ncbi:MAG: septal ring lytic transglycosylase RlpA family protein [Acidobacteria bacterium]|nr:septal ring lytic transglycosylase RlpA family protein [Acidobacteriota bacterium]MBV9475719.1 septal ring lytic transglycosylase RlpA family protein [Acidobacteriota bacterium]
MRPRIFAVALFVVLAYGCATTAPPPAAPPEPLHGIASWYGEEFAGRTTANGEIFDPLLLTAAHRTLPFGTIVDVTNAKTHQSVRVRVNDRGPYIGNRMIDLSYAAAQKIGLIEPGTGEVDVAVVKLGNGDREPPAPLEVTIAEAPAVVTPAPSADAPVSDAPKVDFPIPAPEPIRPAPEPIVIDRVAVETQHADVITRKQVSEDGTKLTDVPVAIVPRTKAPTTLPSTTLPASRGGFVVQVGAFAVEANAKSLQSKLTTLGQRAWIDHDDLFRVRLGPFATRDQAAQARQSLEANGISAIIVAGN